MRRLCLLSTLSVVVALQGCSMVPYYSQAKAVADTGIATAVEDRKEFNDKKLALNVVALCDSSVGAVGRYPDATVRDFINRMCQPGSATVSIEQLKTVLDIMQPPHAVTLAVPPAEPLVEPQ